MRMLNGASLTAEGVLRECSRTEAAPVKIHFSKKGTNSKEHPWLSLEKHLTCNQESVGSTPIG